MSGIRTFLIYFEMEHNGELCDEPTSVQLFEHIWRFRDILEAEISNQITGYEPKIKYNDTDGTILKIRGNDDFDKFIERLENADENEEIVVIIERKKVEKSDNNDNHGSCSKYGDSPIFPSSLQRGKYVGDGAHGTVRMGYHEPTSKWYVIKTIMSKKDTHESIEREILAYQECSKSQFVVEYYGCEVSSAKKELVLEYMDKGDLRPFGVLPVNVHQQVSIALIRGLKHVWKSGPGYIHRDIKPENILCNSDGFVKISDFGAAKRIDNTYRVASSAAGTLLYQAPEQQLGHDYSEKVDVWCYGLTLWELAIGPNLEDHLNHHHENEEIFVQHIEGYPQSLTILIQNCLRHSPLKRWNGDQIENCDYLRDVGINRKVLKDFLSQ